MPNLISKDRTRSPKTAATAAVAEAPLAVATNVVTPSLCLKLRRRPSLLSRRELLRASSSQLLPPVEPHQRTRLHQMISLAPAPPQHPKVLVCSAPETCEPAVMAGASRWLSVATEAPFQAVVQVDSNSQHPAMPVPLITNAEAVSLVATLVRDLVTLMATGASPTTRTRVKTSRSHLASSSSSSSSKVVSSLVTAPGAP
jgi:hypothetical protein